MKSFKEKIEALKIKADTEWEAEAQYRLDNPWLLYSAKIASRIRAKIEDDQELNQTKLAEALNVSRQQVSKILSGKENLTLETIYKISEALGIDLITFPRYKHSYRLGKNQARNEAKAKAKYK